MIYIPSCIQGSWDSCHITMLDWYGFNNSSSCLIDVWGNTKKNKNWGITILPMRFWNNFFFFNDSFGYKNTRFSLGIGAVSFFFDY